MGAEPARIVAAPRSALGGAAPKREAAATHAAPARAAARGPRSSATAIAIAARAATTAAGSAAAKDDPTAARAATTAAAATDTTRPAPRRPGLRRRAPPLDAGAADGEPAARDALPPTERAAAARRPTRPRPAPRRPRPRGDRPDRAPREGGPGTSALNATEAAEVQAARGSLAAERADLEAAEASPEALAAGKEILEELMRHIGFAVRVEVETGDTSRLNVVADPDGREALGSLIGRKGERLSALQHLVNLMLSRRMGEWTRVLVDVEDYRGRRERQLRDLATRAAARVEETGKMIQLEPMPALERRWIHLALRDHPQVATQSIGEEPNRRIVVLLRGG